MAIADPLDGPLTVRFWRDASIRLAGTSLAGIGLLASWVALEDCSEMQSYWQFEVMLRAWNLREAAAAAGGRFPANGEVRFGEIRSGAPALDAWGRALRYERIGADGERARIYTFGDDDRPGGCGCDEDIVVWMDPSDTFVTYDARVEPAAWR